MTKSKIPTEDKSCHNAPVGKGAALQSDGRDEMTNTSLAQTTLPIVGKGTAAIDDEARPINELLGERRRVLARAEAESKRYLELAAIIDKTTLKGGDTGKEWEMLLQKRDRVEKQMDQLWEDVPEASEAIYNARPTSLRDIAAQLDFYLEDAYDGEAHYTNKMDTDLIQFVADTLRKKEAH